MSSSVSPFNLKKQLAFYGAYHTNKVNVAIHVVCVPIIIWCVREAALRVHVAHPLTCHSLPASSLSRGTLLLLAGLGPLPSPPQLTALNSYFPDALTKHVELNWSAIFMSVYWLYYATLDTTAAVSTLYPRTATQLRVSEGDECRLLLLDNLQLMLSPIWYGLYYSAMAVYHNYEHGEAMKIATIVFTFGWISQFYG